MSGKTSIEWADKVWNPVVGCTPVSEGCQNCYARTLHDRRHQAVLNGKIMPKQYKQPFNQIQCLEERLEDPLHWRTPSRVFVNSMGDLFHRDVPYDFIGDVVETISRCPQHIFIVLTKRPSRMQFIFSEVMTALAEKPLPNLWLGVSLSSNNDLWMMDDLLKTPAAVRLVSCEPMLGWVNLMRYFRCTDCCGEDEIGPCKGEPQCPDYQPFGIDWVICGGETGQNARPMHPDWVRSLRDQCQETSVPFFFKGWGSWKPISEMAEEEYSKLYYPAPKWDPEGTNRCRVASRPIGYDGGEHWQRIEQPSYLTFRVGKRRAGRLLDGVEWNQYPEKR